MKQIFNRTCLLFFLCFVFSYFSSTHLAYSQEINWYAYDKGISAAKSDGKKIYLHFFANWCSYCKIMEKKTFKDASVIAYLNENFVPIKVNSDKERKIALRYKIRGLPSNWFLKNDGEKIANRPGYLAPEQLISYLKFIKTDSYKKMNLSDFLKTANIK